MKVITFLSDYGLADEFVGVCHGVIAARCPEARIIDLSHGIPRHDVRRGALVLREALPYLPVGIHLAVVDPGVGGSRLAVALRTADGRHFAGPDNGLLTLAADSSGGIEGAVEITDSPHRLDPVSPTFHGRDIFAPVAAALAAGYALSDLGMPIDAQTLARLEVGEARFEQGVLLAEILSIDTYGNLTLNALSEAVGWNPLASARAFCGERALDLTVATMFAEVEPQRGLIYTDSTGRLAIAVNQGSAATELDAHPGDQIRVELT